MRLEIVTSGNRVAEIFTEMKLELSYSLIIGKK
jgi:hypothetical protein